MKKTVLVIEDNPADARLLEDVLGIIGYDVINATRAKDALELAGSLKPDLIITDAKLPGMDGFEVISILKNHTLTEHIPVIAVTAYPDEWGRKKAMKAGCDEYLGKPVDIHELQELVVNLIGPVTGVPDNTR